MVTTPRGQSEVSTLLEILGMRPVDVLRYCIVCVSTLLEILACIVDEWLRNMWNVFTVSTLLEILASRWLSERAVAPCRFNPS